MSQFIALLNREHHEHKGAFFWAPIVVLALIFVAGGTVAPQIADLRLDVSEEVNISDDGSVQERKRRVEILNRDDSDADHYDDEAARKTAMGIIGLDVAGRTDRELREMLQPGLRTIAVPFYWVLIIVSLFGCIACLHDERKDRSILFWKSMPVSDTNTVISKYMYLAWLAPLVTAGAILIAQLFSLTMLSSLVEDGMAGRVWSNSGLLVQTGQLLLGFLLNGLNLLPIFGWFMFASAWFNSVPFVWALGIPFWLGVLEAIVLDTAVIKSIVAYHIQLPTMPRAVSDDEGPSVALGAAGFGDQLMMLTQGQFLSGVLLGVVFLLATIYVRGMKNEI